LRDPALWLKNFERPAGESPLWISPDMIVCVVVVVFPTLNMLDCLTGLLIPVITIMAVWGGGLRGSRSGIVGRIGRATEIGMGRRP
jgi:uncharacterized membrane protein YGL010W